MWGLGCFPAFSLLWPRRRRVSFGFVFSALGFVAVNGWGGKICRSGFIRSFFSSFDLWATGKAQPRDTYFSDGKGDDHAAGPLPDFGGSEVVFSGQGKGENASKMGKARSGPWHWLLPMPFLTVGAVVGRKSKFRVYSSSKLAARKPVAHVLGASQIPAPGFGLAPLLLCS